ncbi:MAG TPA: Ig-like domain-containing protein [Candidatus Dormibacteraeota bacterium]
MVARAADEPGTIPQGGSVTNNDPLSVMVTESGRIDLSTDGSGTNDPAGANIRADKPSAGATVRSAFLFAASTGFTGHTMVDGDVTLAGTVVHWDLVIPSDIGSSNSWSNVTSIVKPTLDLAPVGITSFLVVEANTTLIDGEGLAVIWNDPAQTKDNTIALLFGAQNTAGDNFQVLYAQPIDKTDPNLLLQMSLGISYGYQTPSFCGQFSTIDVNGTRMSTSAGGQDDGVSDNGGLITVGGIGDNNLLPVDPNSTCDATGFRTDNELYNYGRFVNNGDTSTTIHTHNPSNDDNIFFAGFLLKSVSAVVGAGIVLSPHTATDEATVGATHTVTGTVQDNNGSPVSGATVTFTITAGPNAGASGVCSADVTCKTDASGKVSFTYASNGSAGTDTIQGCFTDATNTLRCNTASKTWVITEKQITAQGTTFNATEGLPFSGKVATFTDPDTNATNAEYSATIDWGDGSAPSAGTISGPIGGSFTVSGTHTYADEGTYPVLVTITDVDRASNFATANSTAIVGDAALLAVCAAPANFTQSFSGATAIFTDANPGATVADFTATTINWGDGTTTAGVVTGPTGGPFTVSGSHTYLTTGPFTITTSIIDDGGATATTTCKVLTFAFAPGGGSFAIGDNNAVVGKSVTFWGAQWWKLNSLSGGPAPASFKGFAENPNAPSCSAATWSSDTGNSTPPPSGPLPAFMGVIVTSKASQSGSTDSGNIVEIVVIQTNAGYQADPGHPGTGTVVAVIVC